MSGAIWRFPPLSQPTPMPGRRKPGPSIPTRSFPAAFMIRRNWNGWLRHDPVIAAHYRDFDFRRARVMQLLEDKTVYVSYRIAGRVYWTTKKVRLRRGEKVITDGKMTLRTRCGNQVSDTRAAKKFRPTNRQSRDWKIPSSLILAPPW